MYECILSACSEVEANVWRSHISGSIAAQGKAVNNRASNVIQFNSPLTNEMKSIGAAFGKPGSFVRRMSVHRSATVGPTTDLNQVIIKNTLAVKESTSNASLQYISRSQSTATPSHVQTLAPRRAYRIRLEAVLADVWSPALPYPGMTMRRSEQLKGSADQIIRKLSIASLASSFHPGKRNGSHSSMTKLSEKSHDSRSTLRSNRQHPENKKPARLPLSELLPADFELGGPNVQSKRRNAFRALTMTMERPFSPLLGGESSLKRAKSVREPQKSIVPVESSLMATLSEQPVELTPLATETSTSTRTDCTTPQPGLLTANDSAKKKGKGRLRRLFG